MLQIGQILKGYCSGFFGNNYEDKRIEALGIDWIVVREIENDLVLFNNERKRFEKTLETT